MYKAITVALFVILSTGMAFSQEVHRLGRDQMVAEKMRSLPFDYESSSKRSDVPLSANFLNQEVALGSTLYDIQTNSSMQNRIVIGEGNYKAAVWIYSQSFEDTYPDRGTGFNEYVNGTWKEMPTARLESERTGWPSLAMLGDGSLHLVAHTSGDQLLSLKRPAGGQSWTESPIPTNVPGGVLWPRSAAGGPDGQTIHMVALTTPAGDLGGSLYLGMSGHLLYYRSSDGGQSWDVVDHVIPGLDSTVYSEIGGDTYTIVSRGNDVAVVVFGVWGDLALYKSFDNGQNWEKTVVLDFPLDKYKVDDLYSVEDIPADPFAPDSLAIYTTDGSGAAVMGNGGLVHLTYADSYVLDNDSTDTSTSFYPSLSGVSYWNESMLTPVTVAALLDYDGNDTIDIQVNQIPRYGNGTLNSQPSIAVDENDGVYIVYPSPTEAFFNELDAQHYRHLLTVKSLDGGESWGPPYDIINPELSDPEVYEFIEAVFPSAHGYVQDTLHLVYQQDFFPGYRVADESDPLADNFITYTGVPVHLIPDAESVNVLDVSPLDFRIFPNPATDRVQLVMDQQRGTDEAIVQVYDSRGISVLTKVFYAHQVDWNMSNLPPGFYLVSVTTRNGRGIKMLVK